MWQDPVVDIEYTTLALVFVREVYVVADVDVDAVVVDWIHNFPVKRLLLSGSIMVRLFQTTVRNSDEVVRHGHTDLHSAIGFVGAVIFIGPPDTGADALAGGYDKVISKIVSSPGYAANPRRVFTHNRNAFVKDFDLVLNSFWKIFFKRYPVNISFAFEFELRRAVRDHCDC